MDASLPLLKAFVIVVLSLHVFLTFSETSFHLILRSVVEI